MPGATRHLLPRRKFGEWSERDERHGRWVGITTWAECLAVERSGSCRDTRRVAPEIKRRRIVAQPDIALYEDRHRLSGKPPSTMEDRFNVLGRRGDRQREERQPPLSRRSPSWNEVDRLQHVLSPAISGSRGLLQTVKPKSYMLLKVFAQNFGALNAECPIFQNV
jgi:hypothetical protein